MEEITKHIITTLIEIPIAIILLKLIFRNSVMFKFSLYIVLFVFFIVTICFFEFKLGLPTVIAAPISFGVGALLFFYLRQTLQKPLEQTINTVKSISEGNLDQNFHQTNSNDELDQLNNSLSNLSGNLKKMLDEIYSNVDNLVRASHQLSKASQQMSQGASEQASSIEEVSSTMEEITANILQNSENSRQTEEVSKEAYKGIQNVVERSTKTVEANKNIAEKITIINDIAFQTNILALNAAVEAARAGEQGKGFAVVAAEVRKLAERSKVAADEIVSLAQASLNLAKETGAVMVETLPKIESSTRLIQEINNASTEQNNGASQVNNAIQQLNNVTQQNASSSEEVASSAEELAIQSEKLKEVLNFFQFSKSIKETKKPETKIKEVPTIEKTKKTTVSRTIIADLPNTTQKSKKGINLDLNFKEENDNEFERF